MPADVILIPVHNRRETTLGLLRHLRADGVFGWATVLVIDDGSSDGTAEAVTREFGEAALLRGDGHWWWGGAIRRGMAWTQARGARRIFWLNDDLAAPPGALRALRDEVAAHGGVAWIEAVAPNGWRYGGHRKTAWGVRHVAAEHVGHGRVDTFSGNCVCLPCDWIARVGLVDDAAFPHGLGDLDYGFRLKRAGATLQPLPGYVAQSADPAQAASESWLGSARPMREIWRDFSSPRSFYYFPAWRRFALRHWGPMWGWAVFAAPYVRWGMIALLRTVTPGIARRLAARRITSPTGRGTSPR